MMKHRLFCWSLCGCLVVSGWAGAAGELLFSALFEGSADAESARADGKAQTARNLEFTEGYRGKGVRILPGGGLAYSRAGNLDLAAGTVMFWFKPEWELNGVGHTVFFATSAMDLYRVGHEGVKAWVQLRVAGDDKPVVNTLLPDLPSDKWVHVCLAWDASRGVWLYLNGERTAAADVTWEPQIPDWDKTFRISVREADNPSSVKTGILDEYRIYDSALDADRIRAIAMGMADGAGSPGALPLPDFTAAFENNPQAIVHGAAIMGLVGVRVGYEIGVSGVGALIKRYAYDQKASLVFRNVAVLSPVTTLSVYIKPTWAAGDGARHELLNFLTEDREVTFVKTIPGKLALTFRGPKGTDSIVLPCTFRENEFSHVVLRWDAASRETRLSVDGREETARLENIPPGFFDGVWDLWVGAGSDDRFKGDAADAVFDQLQIFSADVEPAAIARAVQSDDVSLEWVGTTCKNWSEALTRPLRVPALAGKLLYYAPGTSAEGAPQPLSALKAGTYACVSAHPAETVGISAWARLPEAGDRRTTFLRLRTGGSEFRFLFDPAVNRVNVLVDVAGTTKALPSLYTIIPGEWNHYAVVWHEGRLCFYVNGTYQADVPTSEPPGGEIVGMSRPTGDVQLRDVCAWDGTLSEDELIQLFNAGTAPSFTPVPLNAYEEGIWTLDDAEHVSTATDEMIYLSGVWRCLPKATGNLMPPEDRPVYYSRLPGRWITVPYYSVFDLQGKPVDEIDGRILKRHYQGWYTRYVDIPERFRGHPLFLSSTYVGANASRIYVNNELVHTFAMKHKNAMGEKKYTLADITRFNRQARIKVDVYLHFNEYVDRWNTGDVSLLDIALEKRAPVFSKDTVTFASATSGRITVRSTLVNPGQRSRKLRMQARICDLEGHVLTESEYTDVTPAPGKSGSRESHSRFGNLESGSGSPRPRDTAAQGDPHRCTALSEQDVSLEFSWNKAVPWTPETPTLYQLQLLLQDEQGTLVDAGYPVRFGFRDFAVKDSNIYLNGKKSHVFYMSSSDGIWMRWSQYFGAYPEKTREAVRTLKGNGYNTIGVRISWDQGGALGRTPHFQHHVLDAADELGMLVVLWAPPLSKFMDEERYRECVENFVRTWGNHPSVVFYLTTFNTCGYAWAQLPSKVDDLTYERPDKKEARALALRSDAILAEYDSTREPFHNCSGNLTKLYTTMHYMSFGLPIQEREDWPSKWNRTRKTAFMPAEVGLPYEGQFCDFTYGLSGQKLFVEHAARYFGDSIYRMVTGETPEMYTEHFLADGSLNPVVLAIKSFVAGHHIRAWRGYDVSGLGIFGEQGYCFPVNWQNQRFPVSWENLKTRGIKPDKMHIENRWYDMTRPTPYYHVLNECLSPIFVTIGGRPGHFNEKDHAYFAGESVEKQAIVINDRMEPLSVTFALELRDENNTVVQQLAPDDGIRTAVIPPGETCGKPFRLTAPECSERRQFHIEFRAIHDGKTVGTDRLPIQVFPRQSATVAPSARIGVYDRRGLTASVLEQAGIPARRVTAPEDLAGLDLLVIGRETLSETIDPLLSKLEASSAIEKGLNMLVFEQHECNLANLLFEATSQRYVYIKDRTHPVLNGLTDEDFINWRGDSDLIEACSEPDAASEYSPHYPHSKWKWGNGGIVATWVIRKPQYGSFRPILDCGFDLMNSPLLESMRGKGRLLFCQLDVTSRYGTDPAATTLVHNMFDYMTSCPPAPTATVAWYGPEESALPALLRDNGVNAERLSVPIEPENCDVLLLAGGAADSALAEARAAIEQFLKKGGTLFYLADPEQPGTLAWAPVPVTVQTAAAYHAFPRDTTGVLQGLGNSDFSWREAKAVCQFTCDVPSPIEPAVVTSLSYGQGRLVLCGIDPDRFAPVPRRIGGKDVVTFIDREIHQKAIRIVTTVLNNIGVPFTQPPLFGNQRYMNNTKSARDIMIPLPEWKFHTDPDDRGLAGKWFAPDADDHDWTTLRACESWETQGITTPDRQVKYSDKSKGFRPGESRYAPYDGHAWYRIRITVPETCEAGTPTLVLGAVDDLDWTYFNGVQIGYTGEETEKYWEAERAYAVPKELIHFGGDNTIAIRVLDIHGNGGITRPPAQLEFKMAGENATDTSPSLYVKDLSDYDVNAFHNW